MSRATDGETRAWAALEFEADARWCADRPACVRCLGSGWDDEAGRPCDCAAGVRAYPDPLPVAPVVGEWAA